MVGPGLAKVRLEVIRPPDPGSIAGARASSPEKFAVQAGAFRDRSRAEALRERLKKEAGVARVVKRDEADALWRVVAGEYEHIEDAEAFARKLRESGTEAFAIRLDEAKVAQP
jgi:cell division protein FtsN